MILFLPITNCAIIKIFFMTVEFNTVYGRVSEKLITVIIDEIMNLVHIDKKISRAKIFLKEDETILPSKNKVCEINLAVHSGNLAVHARAQNFSSAAKEAITELKKLIAHQGYRTGRAMGWNSLLVKPGTIAENCY
jgi:ribosome-associated translation inhibitor RaiA